MDNPSDYACRAVSSNQEFGLHFILSRHEYPVLPAVMYLSYAVLDNAHTGFLSLFEQMASEIPPREYGKGLLRSEAYGIGVAKEDRDFLDVLLRQANVENRRVCQSFRRDAATARLLPGRLGVDDRHRMALSSKEH